MTARWSVLFLCLCTVLWVGCKGELRNNKPLTGVIANFEGASMSNAFGNLWQSVGGGAGTIATVELATNGYAGSGYALRVSGLRPQRPSPTQVAGVRTALVGQPRIADPNQTPIALDVSGYRGIAFAMKSQPGSNYILQFTSALIPDSDQYNAYLTFNPAEPSGWTEYQIPFTQFNQEGYGSTQRPWTGEYLTHFTIYANDPGEFSFQLDNVRFY